jgi:hypothetical protein
LQLLGKPAKRHPAIFLQGFDNRPVNFVHLV